MTRSEIEDAKRELDKRLAGVARAIRQSDAYYETQGSLDLDQIETAGTPVLQAINQSAETDAEMDALKAWRTKRIADFQALRGILTERAGLLVGKTEVPSA